MGNAAAIIATLELTRGKFKTEIEATETDLKKVQGTVKETAAAVSVLERELQKDSGNKALKENLSTLKTSLRDAEKEMKVLETQKKRLDAALGTTPAPKPPAQSESKETPINYDDESYTRFRGRQNGSGEAGHEGNARMSSMEAGHSVRAVFGSLGAGQSLGQSLQMELPRLLQASMAPLGAILGIEAATGIVTGIVTAVQKAKELKKEIAEALGGGGGGSGYASSNALTKQMDAVAEQRDKLLGNESLLDKGANFAKNFFRAATSPTDHQSVESERDDQIAALEQRRIENGEESVRRKAAGMELDRRAAAEGEEAVALDRERLALKERIQAVQDDKNLDGTAQAKMVDLLRQESAEREKHIRLIQAKQNIEDEAHHANAEDRKYGADTDVTKAQHALDEAKKKRDLLPYNSREWNAAGDDVGDKEADLRKASQEQSERAAQRRDANRVAGMTGTEAAKQRQALEDEKARLRAQLDKKSGTYEPNQEKRNDIEQRQLAEVNSKLRAQDRAEAQREFQRRKNEIAASEGLGPTDKIRAIDARVKVNRDEQADNAAHEKDKNRASELTSEAAQLGRQRKEIEVSSARELANSVAQTKEMQLQQSGQGVAARVVAIRAQYEERIAAALREGKGELASQLQLQQQMALNAVRMAAYFSSPAQQQAQRQAQRQAQQAQARFDRDDGLQSIHRDAGGRPIDGYDPVLGRRRKFGDRSMFDQNGNPVGGSGKPLDTKATESAENASDASFDARFHPGRVQPDRRPVATADPQQQHSQDDSNIGDAVDVLEDIRDILDDRLKLTIEV